MPAREAAAEAEADANADAAPGRNARRRESVGATAVQLAEA